MIDVGIDFETYYDGDYTLRSMTTTEYILDPRFEAIGVSLSIGGLPAIWYTGSRDYLKAILHKVPWGRCRAIAHNAFFDGGILEWIFDCHPAEYLCTMMGSRPFIAPYTGGTSLASVAEFWDLGVKGDEVIKAKGKHRADFTPAELSQYGEYCCNDTNLTMGAARKLDEYLPAEERRLVDLTVKKYVRPRLELDAQAIEARVADIATKRSTIEQAAAALGCPPSTLRSRTKYAAKLESYLGIVPKKTSKTTGEETYAFAKDDEDFISLLTHDDPRIRTLVEAKLFTSSSMETKRLERFKAIHKLDLGGRHLLPVPLLYYGAHPGRWSGYDKINLQNLTRVKRDKQTKQVLAGHLRFALRAPDGYSVVAADLSNIEARLVATLARCGPLVSAFRDGRDIYCEFATKIYGRTITKANEVERFVGKTCILGLGYGMGADKLGMQMKIARVKLGPPMLRNVVWLYRNTYAQIPELWDRLGAYGYEMIRANCLLTYGPLTFMHERILLPNGMPVIYPGLKVGIARGQQELYFRSKRKGGGEEGTPSKLWGGVFTENVTQGLARIVISSAELRLADRGLHAALQAHDELVFVVRDDLVDEAKAMIEEELTAVVPWLPDLPVACEIKHGPTYGDAK